MNSSSYQHRFYGKSVPFGSFEETIKNHSIRGYFSSAQAIADYAEVLMYLRKKLSAQNSPIIVIGGSYGGMLASWFRLKYPHIALGALASSAPILYFDGPTPQNGYYFLVTKDFKEVSENCYKTIKESWSEIDKVASMSNGLSVLSKRFKTCTHLNNSSELKDYLDSMYATAAQYNQPPEYPVTKVCSSIDGAFEGSDILGRIFAGVVGYKGNWSCYDTNQNNHPSETSVGWRWQVSYLCSFGINYPTNRKQFDITCSEMVIPIGRGRNDTMFPPSPFDFKQYSDHCKSLFGVPPRPHWVTTYYGGHDGNAWIFFQQR
ncbi:unnamed protein product [Ilex paraguariensis]|uniref:Lysosomal Pro-X carboxypeptidase n=1 Tax=Ilex paraguariensis TaxID=185542 RepID=A0ABC8V0B6_9AQUA